jgi:hypothetical protein
VYVYDAVDCHVKFVDNADIDSVGVERGNALPAHPSTERHSGNSMIFSAEVYKHCEGFSERHVLLDTCAGESLFKNRNLLYSIEPSPQPMIISDVNPKGSPLIITECSKTDLGSAYYDPKCIANILSFGNIGESVM